MRIRTHKTRNTAARRGVVTLEFIVAAPIVFIAFVAIFEFGFLAIMLQFGHAALIEGTRRGAELYPEYFLLDQPGPENDIADAVVEVVNEHLAIHGLEIFDPSQGAADNPDRPNVRIVIERGGETVSRGADVSFPEGYVSTPEGEPPGANEIRVTLSFPIVDADSPRGSGRPVPDWLSLFGVSLTDFVFKASSRMPLE